MFLSTCVWLPSILAMKTKHSKTSCVTHLPQCVLIALSGVLGIHTIKNPAYGRQSISRPMRVRVCVQPCTLSWSANWNKFAKKEVQHKIKSNPWFTKNNKLQWRFFFNLCVEGATILSINYFCWDWKRTRHLIIWRCNWILKIIGCRCLGLASEGRV